MSLQRERARPGYLEPELDAEQEVDVRGLWSAISARWWLPVAGLLAGIAVGYALSLGGSSVYRADAIIYLGNPLGPGGSTPLANIAATPRQVGELVRSAAWLNEAARRSGMRASQLRGNVSTQAVSPGVTVRAVPTLLVEIGVKGDAPRKVAAAANALAARVVDEISAYPKVKIAKYEQRLEGINDRLESVASRIAALEAVIRDSRGLAPLERLELISQIDNSEQRRGSLLDQQSDVQQFLSLAREIESARVLNRAVAVKTTARSTRNSILVGAVLGLILGTLAALLWEPFRARFARV